MLVRAGIGQAARSFRPSALFASALFRPLAIMTGLALCTVLVRLPFLSHAGVDESFYLVVARQWLEGHPPYAYSFDVKPPLLFALMAAAETLFGPSLLAAKVLTMTAVSATASALYLLGRRFIGELSGVAGALFYIAASLTLSGTCSPAELIMAPFTAFGVLAGLGAALTPGRTRLWLGFGAGLLFGAAGCVKQTAIFEALPLAVFLFLRHPPGDGLKVLAAFAAGFFIVPMGFALFFLAEGYFGAFFRDVVVSAAGRMSTDYIPWSKAFTRVGIELMILLPLLILATAAWLFRGAFRTQSPPSVLGFMGAWGAGALAGVLAGRGMCDFYMLAVLPPFCLLAGAFIEQGVAGSRAKGALWLARALAFASVMVFFTIVIGYMSQLIDDGMPAEEAAAAMRSAGLRKGDRILVADRDLSVYLASGAKPPTPVFHPIQLLCNFAFEGAANAFEDSLKSRPAFIVVADPPYRLSCERPGLRALLEATLAGDYRLVGHFGSRTALRPQGLKVYALSLHSAACAPSSFGGRHLNAVKGTLRSQAQAYASAWR